MNEIPVKHEGIVCGLKGEIAAVRLINISACTSCHAKAVCAVSENDNKIVEVMISGVSLAEGDKVRVLFNESQGIKALAMGYIYPFFIMLAVLIFSWVITGSESQSGIYALLALPPYYLVLYCFKKRLHRTFSFKLEKLNV